MSTEDAMDAPPPPETVQRPGGQTLIPDFDDMEDMMEQVRQEVAERKAADDAAQAAHVAKPAQAEKPAQPEPQAARAPKPSEIPTAITPETRSSLPPTPVSQLQGGSPIRVRLEWVAGILATVAVVLGGLWWIRA